MVKCKIRGEYYKKQSVLQIIKFTPFSISAGIIQTVSFAIFNEEFKFKYRTAYLIALILSVIWNFTFKSAVNVPVIWQSYLVFIQYSRLYQHGLGHLAESAGINEYIILFVTMCSNLVLEFLLSKFVIYRNCENTSGKK